MKFIHTSDLHIGKIVNEFSMLKEQSYVLGQILELAKLHRVDAVVIAGDIYDRSIPPANAISILDHFLSELIEARISVLAIGGNHDSPERLSFVNGILASRGLHIEGEFNGTIKYVDYKDSFGMVRMHLLPFMKPIYVNAYFKEEIITYEASVRALVEHLCWLEGERNVLVTHHFVTNKGVEPECSDSETRVTVGGTDNVDVSCFKAFDYVALGHIHGSQQIGELPVYYSGSPIKYSFSERFHEKSVQLVEMKEKGNLIITHCPLYPIHDMRRIQGNLNDLISEAVYNKGDVNDYIWAVLTNEEELLDPMGTLRSVYPNTMQLEFLKNQIREDEYVQTVQQLKQKSTLELVSDFYELVTGSELDEDKKSVLLEAIERAEEIVE